MSLKRINFIKYPTKPDGDCGYYAVLHSLLKLYPTEVIMDKLGLKNEPILKNKKLIEYDNDSIMDIRQKFYDISKEIGEIDVPQIYNNGELINGKLENIMVDKTFIDSQRIYYLYKLFDDIIIYIYDEEKKEWYTPDVNDGFSFEINKESTRDKIMYLTFKDIHYDVLYPKNSFNKINILPYGILGEAGNLDVPEDCIIIDPAGLNFIKGIPQEAGGASGEIYKYINLRDRFPDDIITNINKTGDVAYHKYNNEGKDIHVIHVIGPDLRKEEFNKLKSGEIEMILSDIYTKIIHIFCKLKFNKLRLLPISGGIYSGNFKKLFPLITRNSIFKCINELDDAFKSYLHKNSIYKHSVYHLDEQNFEEHGINLCIFKKEEILSFNEYFSLPLNYNFDTDNGGGKKPKSKADEKPKSKAEEKSKPKAKEKPKSKADEKPKPKAEEKPKSKAEEKPKPKAEEKPKSKAEEKPKLKADEKPKPKAEEKPKSKADEKPKPKAEEKPKPKAEKKLDKKIKLKTNEKQHKNKTEKKQNSNTTNKLKFNKSWWNIELSPGENVEENINSNEDVSINIFIERNDKSMRSIYSELIELDNYNEEIYTNIIDFISSLDKSKISNYINIRKLVESNIKYILTMTNDRISQYIELLSTINLDNINIIDIIKISFIINNLRQNIKFIDESEKQKLNKNINKFYRLNKFITPKDERLISNIFTNEEINNIHKLYTKPKKTPGMSLPEKSEKPKKPPSMTLSEESKKPKKTPGMSLPEKSEKPKKTKKDLSTSNIKNTTHKKQDKK